MIAIGCDHGGLQIKNAVIDYMKENGIEPREVWEPTVKEAVDQYEQKLGDAILEDMGSDIERVLMEIY